MTEGKLANQGIDVGILQQRRKRVTPGLWCRNIRPIKPAHDPSETQPDGLRLDHAGISPYSARSTMKFLAGRISDVCLSTPRHFALEIDLVACQRGSGIGTKPT